MGADVIGFTWSSITAFVRIGTKAGLFPSALTVTESCEQVREWLGMPGARLVGPTPQHLDVLSRLLEVAGSGGNLVPDAHLAAIAIEHRADVVSYDSDFARFPGLRVWRPDELLRP
ncbi:hypothetical protein BCF74_11394 [Knoellia remsis]|uniref:PIN domain-containing protein n=1 Tax=Knoellia remsis TaxID=407159 RepID=A0A2T0UJR8_9MICO|nr:TA system VapC family ribonuclease toxin [Knoellia remsis]PRY58170.1 hypothetical protein BCF74_11394 [Knoellia remsis]